MKLRAIKEMSMNDNWNDDIPIYKQLRERIAARILDGSFKEGEAIPSVRTVAAESKVNHLTVAKAYQELVDEGVLEMKRGRGMFVVDGARNTLLSDEREKFIRDELPALVTRLASLNITVDNLIQLIAGKDK